MWWLFKKKKSAVEKLPVLKTERPGLGYRLAKARRKDYEVKIALVYEGKPIRTFDVLIKANSRDNAAYLADKDLTLKVLSAKQHKK